MLTTSWRPIGLALSLCACVGLVLAGAGPSTAATAVTARPSRVVVADQNSPGTEIGNAGQLTDAVPSSGTVNSEPDLWWVIYPGTQGGSVDLTVTNTGTGDLCTFTANLYDTDGTADGALAAKSLAVGTSGDLSGSAPGSDRYYVQITDCSSTSTYTVTLNSGDGGTAPAPIIGTASPGTGIATAQTLLGNNQYADSLIFGPTIEHWYVLYKKPDANVGTIRIENTTVTPVAHCAVLSATLYTNAGTNAPVGNLQLSPNAAGTLGVPGKLSGDPQGQYFLEITEDMFECQSGGAAYSVLPQAQAEFGSAAKPASGKIPAATSSSAKAWPPLAGGLVYSGSINFAHGAQNWYVLYKKPDTHTAIIQLANTTPDGSTSCGTFLASLYSTGGSHGLLTNVSLSNDAAGSLVLPAKLATNPQGVYFVQITADPDSCGTGGAHFTIELLQKAEFSVPALKVGSTTLKNGTIHKAYQTAIAVSEGKKPYAFVPLSSLPPGLTLNATTGVISGKPTKRGTFELKVRIADSSKPTRKSVTDEFTITIS